MNPNLGTVVDHRCDFFGAILVVATCLFSVGLKDSLGSAAVGLAISNTIQVCVCAVLRRR
jgi:hypothetical protein